MITISLADLLTTINTVILLGICAFYFKNHYVIIEKETWDSAIEVCEEYTKEHQETEELAGGEGIQVGFGAEYLEDDEEEEENKR